MSGGVDSAVTALILMQRGFRVVGYTMDLGRENESDAIAKTREVSKSLGIDLKIVSLGDIWKDKVCDYVRGSYLDGETPNPCVRCNELVKMRLLPELAFGDGFERFATGHYARSDEQGRLYRARDREKDQSYFLYRVPRSILSKVEFPLGNLTKAQVRETAKEFKLPIPERQESQDFCGGDVKKMVSSEPKKGEIVTLAGKVIGEHAGFWNYTVGMRKGLGIGGGIPYYVARIDALNNRVIVGHKEDVFVKSFRIHDIVGEAKGELYMKIRSAGEPRGPVLVDGALVACEEGVLGVSPGQSAVFYDGEEIVGGGIISKASI